MFDLTRLKLLRELAHRGTMTAVAEACGLTSSAVSQQLATLEREARTPLTERTGRRVRLTPAGMRLAAHAAAVLQAVEAAVLDLQAASELPRGTLDVAVFATFARARLLPALSRLRTTLPELRIVVHELEPVDSLEAVRDGRCDVALSFAYNLVPRTETPGLVSTRLMTEPVLLALPPRFEGSPDPIDLAALADADWIVGARQSDDRLLAERACAVAGFAPRMTHAVADYELLLGMVGAGLGVGFVPALGFEVPSAAAVVRRTPAGPPLSRQIDAVTRSALAATPRLRALIAELSGA
jgi:DNA-binding transcriptional LysR family regulator